VERTAKLFRNGSSQAVRLPKEFRVPGREVIMKRFGGMIILVPKVYRKSDLAAALAEIGPVKLAPRAQPRKARGRGA
jgi:antitoxin VapB